MVVETFYMINLRKAIMKRIFVVVVLLTASAAFVSAQSKDVAALENLILQQIEAQRAFDRAKLDSIVTSDYIEISPVGEFDPRAKMLDFYKPELKTSEVEVKHQLNEFSTRVYGKFGIVIVRIDYTMVKDGNPLPPRSLRATFVCRTESGKWKIASAQFTGIRPSAPPAK